MRPSSFCLASDRDKGNGSPHCLTSRAVDERSVSHRQHEPQRRLRVLSVAVQRCIP